jgi:hypothetical protein
LIWRTPMMGSFTTAVCQSAAAGGGIATPKVGVLSRTSGNTPARRHERSTEEQGLAHRDTTNAQATSLGVRGDLEWRWRESNPRPMARDQGFSGRSLPVAFLSPGDHASKSPSRAQSLFKSPRVPRPDPRALAF